MLSYACRMVIVGAGYIACEQACIFNNFGTEVHMLYMEEVALNGELYILPISLVSTKCSLPHFAQALDSPQIADIVFHGLPLRCQGANRPSDCDCNRQQQKQ